MPDLINWNSEEPLSDDLIEKLADIVESGEVIVYPTNTLYGLGASIFSEPGVKKARAIKERPDRMPISIIATEGQIELLCELTPKTRQFIRSSDIRVTAILPAQDTAPFRVLHEGTLAIRLPTSEMMRSLIRRTGPLTTTSANVHSKDAPKTCDEAMVQLGDMVAVYIDSGEVGGVPSTLVDFTGPEPRIIREGALSAEEVKSLYG